MDWRYICRANRWPRPSGKTLFWIGYFLDGLLSEISVFLIALQYGAPAGGTG
jgi:hypothetical protein